MSGNGDIRELITAEYIEIKKEQVKRIGFRDNMVFVQLAAIGSIGSWVLTNFGKPHSLDVLLVIPWVCVILGWAYMVNDHAISRMGRYVRTVMEPRLAAFGRPLPVAVVEEDGQRFTIEETFGWENFHRIDGLRKSRKSLQWVIDEVAFTAPGVLAIAIYAFVDHRPNMPLGMAFVLLLEFAAMILIATVIFEYSDFKRDSPDRPVTHSPDSHSSDRAMATHVTDE